MKLGAERSHRRSPPRPEPRLRTGERPRDWSSQDSPRTCYDPRGALSPLAHVPKSRICAAYRVHKAIQTNRCDPESSGLRRPSWRGTQLAPRRHERRGRGRGFQCPPIRSRRGGWSVSCRPRRGLPAIRRRKQPPRRINANQKTNQTEVHERERTHRVIDNVHQSWPDRVDARRKAERERPRRSQDHLWPARSPLSQDRTPIQITMQS